MGSRGPYCVLARYRVALPDICSWHAQTQKDCPCFAVLMLMQSMVKIEKRNGQSSSGSTARIIAGWRACRTAFDRDRRGFAGATRLIAFLRKTWTIQVRPCPFADVILACMRRCCAFCSAFQQFLFVK